MPRNREIEYEKMKQARIARRIARANKLRDNPDACIGRNGRLTLRTQQEAKCEMCPTIFSFVRTTRPHRFCAACKILRERDRLARKFTMSYQEKKERRENRQRPLPYAGFDPSERPLEYQE